MKAFFSNKLFFIMFFSFFQSQKLFDFFSKKPTIKVERHFFWNTIIWYAFYSKFAIFSDFEKIKFCLENTRFFKWNLWTFWEVLLLQSHSTDSNWQQFGDRKFWNSKNPRSDLIHWQVSVWAKNNNTICRCVFWKGAICCFNTLKVEFWQLVINLSWKCKS